MPSRMQNARSKPGVDVDLAGGQTTFGITGTEGKFSTNAGDSAASFAKEVV